MANHSSPERTTDKCIHIFVRYCLDDQTPKYLKGAMCVGMKHFINIFGAKLFGEHLSLPIYIYLYRIGAAAVCLLVFEDLFCWVYFHTRI